MFKFRKVKSKSFHIPFFNRFKEVTESDKEVLKNLGKERITVIALDDYEDIFDDFDISPYYLRRISNDFKEELMRRLKEVNGDGKLHIILTVPQSLRKMSTEAEVHKRLHFFVNHEYEKIRKKFIFSLMKSIAFLTLGPAFLVTSYLLRKAHLVSEYLMVGVYFFTWEGLDSLIDTFSNLKVKLNMYKTLKNSRISFLSEETFEKLEVSMYGRGNIGSR